MTERRLRRHQPPLPLSSVPPPSPPAASSPESMPIAISQPDAPSASPSPAPEAARPLSSKPPPSSSAISISNPRPDLVSSAAIVDSAADLDPSTATASESSGPAKIACRPRKTRKLAASCSPAAQGRAGEGGVTSSRPVGDRKGACAPGGTRPHPQQLRQIGVSARKASYLHDLANKYRNGILSDASIAAMDDKSLFTMLNMVKGIGAWSVHMFMIFSLHRPDVLPVGDLGVRKGVQLLYGLDALPRPSQMEQLCERWRPYRSVGSWYMWRLVEAKGMPAALATASSGVAVAATADGGGGCGGTSLVVRVPSPLPPPHLQLQMQQQYWPQHHHLQQHQHLHPPQHPPHLQQHQPQHQLQIRPQLFDAMQSIPNLG